MAKRKRLTPANPGFAEDPGLETKSIAGPGDGVMRVPISDVAAESSAHAALDEVSQRMAWERENGRRIIRVPLDQIQLDYLVRDRIPSEEEALEGLVRSIRSRGQQVPIELVELAEGRYGLISGWRRCQALRQLADEGGGDGSVLALLRRPDTASDAYLAMVEENELRLGLSYFERARIALRAVEQGVFPTEKAALLTLFENASRPRRSKIRSFLPLVRHLDGALLYPQMIGERLGLRLSKALEADEGFGPALAAHLRRDPAENAAQEQRLLAEALAGGLETPAETPEIESIEGSRIRKYYDREVRPGVMLRVYSKDGRMEIWGQGLTPDLRLQVMGLLEDYT